MSSYDENGRGGNFAPIWAQVGVECSECFNNIDRVEGCRLYSFNGDHICESCLRKVLTAHKYGREGLCESCNDGVLTYVLPCTEQNKHKWLCVDCYIENFDSISAYDPTED